MNEKVKSFFNIVPLVQVIIYSIIILTISALYLNYVFQDKLMTIILAIITVFVYLYSKVYLEKKLDKEQFIYKQIQLYVMSMIYNMERGLNVYDSLNYSKDKLDKEIQKDIQTTVSQLEKDVRLDTTHFRRYKFDALDIFHHLLKIKYDKGGNVKELFKNVNTYVNVEIEMREKLLNKFKTSRTILLIMLYLVVSVPLFFILRAPDLYETFMSSPNAYIINATFYLLILMCFFFIGKFSTNIKFTK